MNEVVEILNEDQFERALQADLPVFVDFWAPWCGPCKSMMPIVSELAKQYTHQITFLKVNIEQLPAIASRYNIRSIPHCILFQGGVPLDTVTGLQSSSILIDFLKNHLPHLQEQQ